MGNHFDSCRRIGAVRGQKLPELAKGMGQGIKEFKKPHETSKANSTGRWMTIPPTPPPAPQITEQTSENDEAGDTKRTPNFKTVP